MTRIIRRTEEPYDAIIGADLHIREDIPECRTDDYVVAQFDKMTFLRHLCMKNNDCPFLVAGDLFDHWKPSPWLLSRCLELLPDKIIAIPGQHDLPNHNVEEFARTGMNTLVQAGRLTILTHGRSADLTQPNAVFGYSYGQKPAEKRQKVEKGRNLLLLHQLVCDQDQPWKDAGASKALSLLKSLPSFDLIVTGDNHQQFVVEHEGRWLINPGSMMRMTTIQEDHTPAVYGWRAKDNSVTKIPLPIQQNVISKTHLDKEKKETRDARLEAYIKRAKKQCETKLSFVANLESYIKNNGIDDSVAKLIWKAMED